MESAGTPETSVKVYQTTRCYNQEDSHIHLETSTLKLVEARRNNMLHVLVFKLVSQRRKEVGARFRKGGVVVGVETYKVVYSLWRKSHVLYDPPADTEGVVGFL
jgi:hypothetical protein